MSYGIEIFDETGVRTLGMGDFTYSKIFEVDIPAPGGDTAPYNVTVPGFTDSECVVVFTPLSYISGAQPDNGLPPDMRGFVPVYRSPGGNVVSVIRRVLGRYLNPGSGQFVQGYGTTPACKMEVFRIFGG